MPWRTITADDITADFTPVEIATLNGIQGANDLLPGKLTDAIGEALDAIVAGGGQIDQDTTLVPDLLRSDVVNIAKWNWLLSFPKLKSLQTQERGTAFKASRERIDGVSTGKPKTPLPSNPQGNIKAPVNAIAQIRRGRRVRTDSFDRLGET